MELRKHQREAVALATNMADGELDSAVVHVCPGGGKSFIPPLMMEKFPQNWKLLWIVPRLGLRHQAALSSGRHFGITLREAGNEARPYRGADGAVITHSTLVQHPELWRECTESDPTFLFIDEAHHASVNTKGEKNELAKAIGMLTPKVRVLATGTLERNLKSQMIYGVPYHESNGRLTVDPAGVDIKYSRADALEDGVIVPVEFFCVDGSVEWVDGEGVGHSTTLSGADQGHAPGAIHTAMRTGYATEMLHRGLQHWRAGGSHGKVIIVCSSQAHARSVREIASGYGGAVLAVSDDGPQAQDNLKEFQYGAAQILVTVAMAYEGLDVPEITHGICLTHYRSAPWIEQMLARGTRIHPEKTMCYWWVPDDQLMVDVINKIRSEDVSPIADGDGGGGGGGGGGLDIVPIRGESGDVRVTGLDGDGLDRDRKKQLADFLAAMHITNTEAMSLIGANGDPEPATIKPAGARELTLSEQEQAARYKLCRESQRVAREKNRPNKYVNAEIKAIDGVPVKESTLGQLKNKQEVLQARYPRGRKS